MSAVRRWCLAIVLAASAGPAAAQPVTVFRDVRVFDGTSATLSPPTSVLVRGNLIEKIAADLALPDGAAVVAGGGRTLMPGLIDAHVHLAMAAIPQAVLMTADLGYIHLHAAKEAERTLLRGFTTVRDASGPVFGLKRAIDEGLVPGPRIYPSGAMVSQTAGHGDYRMPWDVPKRPGPNRAEELGAGAVADGPGAVLRAVREQLLLGATQVKLAAGGGVSSSFDPLDVTQFTADEMRAAVQAADDWGTYVMVHAYTPTAVRRAVEAGVKCIEHGQLMDEDTARLLAAKGVWLSTQPFLDDADATRPATADGRKKQLEMMEGTDVSVRLAVKHKVKIAFGTDALFDAKTAARQNRDLAKMSRWFAAADVLRMATSGNAALLALSGKRNPYPGKLGVVAEGALADLLLIDGDPLADLKLIADPKHIVVVMKNGAVYKNAVPK